MSDLDALLGAPLGELPAVITVDVYALALAEIRRNRALIELLRRELGIASNAVAFRTQECRERRDEIKQLRVELAEIHDARAEIERLHQELGHARTAKAVHAKGIRDAHAEIDRLAAELARDKCGDKLCPRCSVEVAAEAAAEKESTDG